MKIPGKFRCAPGPLSASPIRLLPVLCLVALMGGESFSQTTITGEIRPRAEFRNGFKKLRNEKDDPAFFVEQRSRLSVDHRAETINFLLTLQDVRVWGNTDQIYKYDPSLSNVREAWGEYRISKSFSIKAGRQAISYDNERFLGALEWAQQGRSHDALLVKFRNDSANLQLHIGGAYNQRVDFEPAKLSSTFYSGVNNYKTMQYLWLHKDFREENFSLVFLNDGRQRPSDSAMYYRQTYGFFGHMKRGKLQVSGELYYQGGRTQAYNDNNINAWMAAVNFGYEVAAGTSLILGVDYLSGTGGNDTGNRSFDPAYGTNHSFYGFMDYFYVGNPHGQNGKVAGLSDLYLKSVTKLSLLSDAKVDLHYFSSAAGVYDPLTLEPLSRRLGTEADIVFTARFSTTVVFNFGYSQMFGTSSLEILKGNNGDKDLVNNWIWTMLTIKPVLLQLKKQ